MRIINNFELLAELIDVTKLKYTVGNNVAIGMIENINYLQSNNIRYYNKFDLFSVLLYVVGGAKELKYLLM